MPNVVQLFDTACMCNNAYLGGGTTVVGQPTEGAMLQAACKLGTYTDIGDVCVCMKYHSTIHPITIPHQLITTFL